MPRSEAIARWKAELAEAERQLDAGSLRFRWLRRIYARLYRFLLASYVDRSWPADEEQRLSAGQHSRMQFVDHTTTEPGLQPRSVDRIRSTLQSVREANEDRQSRGDQGDVSSQDWITLFSSGQKKTLRCLQRYLGELKIESRLLSRTTDCALQVHHADFDRAYSVARDFTENTSPDASTSEPGIRLIRRRTSDARFSSLTFFVFIVIVSLLPLLLFRPSRLEPFYFFLWMLSCWIGFGVATRSSRRSG